MTSLEDYIKDSLPEGTKQAATGFWTVKCPVCGDYQKRGGFKFEKDKIIYNCFRGKCTARTAYTYGTVMTSKFKKILKAFDIDIPLEYLTQKSKIQEALQPELYEKHFYKDISLNSDFIKLDIFRHKIFVDYLHQRGIHDTDYYIGSSGQWTNKLIVPFRLYDSLIGWQGIDIRRGIYLKSSGNTDLLYFSTNTIPKEPLIVEGVFDAKSIPDGVATLQSTISKKQAYLLRNSSPILIPDRKDSNYLHAAKLYGWRMSIPDWKEKDANAAIQKYGRLVVAKMIHDGICHNYNEAEVKYKMWRSR